MSDDQIRCPVCLPRSGGSHYTGAECPHCRADVGVGCTTPSRGRYRGTRAPLGCSHQKRARLCPCCRGKLTVSPQRAAPFLLVAD